MPLRNRTLAALLLFLLAATPLLRASAWDGHPKLIVVIVVDQLRGDEIERNRAAFKGPNGFRLFLDDGAVFPDCYYDYANTRTAPGHATIATGAYSDGHGIAQNDWWDLARNTKRPVSSVEDDRYTVVGMGANSAQTSASPRNLMASTLGDELRLATHGASRVYAVSLKDRAAILSAGAAANGAFWIDEASGKFITSSFYMTELPQWSQQFNASGAAAQAEQHAGLTNVKNFYDEVGATPSGNDYELDFADALVRGEGLGTHATPDLLIVSLSPNDLMGHHFGPDSPEADAMVKSLDTSLDTFFSSLDKEIEGGLGNVWIALSADHGVAPSVAVSSALGLPGANIPARALTAALNNALNAKFSPGEKQEYMLPQQLLPYLALDERTFARAGINEQEAEDAVLAALPGAFKSLSGVPATDAKPEDAAAVNSQHRWPAPPTLAHSYSRLDIAKGNFPVSEWGKLLAHSYSAQNGWWVFAMPEAFQMGGSDPTHSDHFSAWSYDRHVPLMFYGANFAHGVYRGRVAPVDMAATFASLLGINQPSASVGNVLTQALRTPVYPATPVRRRRTTRATKAAQP